MQSTRCLCPQHTGLWKDFFVTHTWHVLKVISTDILLNEGKQVSLPVSFTKVESLSHLGRLHFFYLQEDSV